MALGGRPQGNEQEPVTESHAARLNLTLIARKRPLLGTSLVISSHRITPKLYASTCMFQHPDCADAHSCMLKQKRSVGSKGKEAEKAGCFCCSYRRSQTASLLNAAEQKDSIKTGMLPQEHRAQGAHKPCLTFSVQGPFNMSSGAEYAKVAACVRRGAEEPIT